MEENQQLSNQGLTPYFSRAGIWAFSIGTSIGWGSFVVTCSTYLFQAGILGTIFGVLLGMAVIEQIIRIAVISPWAFISFGNAIAAGMADYEKEHHNCLQRVFDLADRRMYERKKFLKELV